MFSYTNTKCIFHWIHRYFNASFTMSWDLFTTFCTVYMYGKLYSNNDVKYVIGKVHVLKLPKGIHNNASYQNVTNSFLSLQLLMPLSHPSHWQFLLKAFLDCYSGVHISLHTVHDTTLRLAIKLGRHWANTHVPTHLTLLEYFLLNLAFLALQLK